ncbi:winged helix-turn-helix transcriptional regulator [Amycolatopsis nalaikhensis]|uniref:Winged helix-turn-helix transcriptional regulator n=1 Tax=Amycolatopsis nalaikhensis TaxID=715472 RepID=A0ABY8XEQ2_9PSEU|nr:winged helix-turn-helix transcriptional regulator [Amycolatopsis sp. 2-2]WIV54099.1 winged helix-turn-helix transcriptional regulator [Amycolatopsis sp. 2-2]
MTGPVPAPVIYRLTPYGTTVRPVVESVRVWGEAHLRHTDDEAAAGEAMGCAHSVA